MFANDILLICGDEDENHARKKYLRNWETSVTG